MNHHDIRLIEIGQKEGYAKAVEDIVAMLRDDTSGPMFPICFARRIEARFAEQKKNAFLQDTTPDTLSVTPKE